MRFYTSHLEDDSDVLASNKQITKAQLAHRKPPLNHRDGLNMCQRELCRKKKNAFQFQMFFFFGAEVYGGIKGTGCVFPRVRSLVNKARLLTSFDFHVFRRVSVSDQTFKHPSPNPREKKEENAKIPENPSSEHASLSPLPQTDTANSEFAVQDF